MAPKWLTSACCLCNSRLKKDFLPFSAAANRQPLPLEVTKGVRLVALFIQIGEATLHVPAEKQPNCTHVASI